MKKLLLAAMLLSLGCSAQAVEVEGVKVADSVHVGSSDLVLNGAGLRSVFIIDLYVAALYLDAKQVSAAGVLANAADKRISLHLKRDITAEHLLSAFKKAMEKNHTPQELQALQGPLQQFEQVFGKVGEAKEGSVINLDYRHDAGTVVTVNGVEQGVIPGAAFYGALMKIWLGEKPAQDDLKKKLLGGH
ncbi:MAG: chalcone isomerase family protein [Gallionella sp.]|nr:chalcone isomerase family protein [Gallionella sp.]MDD4947780.1 chalcone isomerase family protein [Gallionella sp.]